MSTGEPYLLHAFEPRDRMMVEICPEREIPFGVVLIRAEVPITRLSDGRLHIMTVGEQRFRIQAYHPERPYLTGCVECLDEPLGNPLRAHRPAAELDRPRSAGA